MKQLRIISFLLPVLMVIITACREDGPDLDDHRLAQKIPYIEVTEDYLVGVDYAYTPTTFSSTNPFGATKVQSLFTTPPVLGYYSNINELTPNGSEKILDAHLRWMRQARVDYMLLTFHALNLTGSTAFHTDTAYIHRIMESPQLGNLKFALKYYFGSTLLGSVFPTKTDSTMILEYKIPDGDKKIVRDFEETMIPYFNMPNYLKVNGKYVVYFDNAYRLYSLDNQGIFDKIHQHMKDIGYDVYIVGQQGNWSPPARYIDFLKNTVDAIYHDCYANVPSNDFNRVYMFNACVNEAWKYSKAMFNAWGTDYVPNISPSWNANLGNPNAAGTYYNPYIERNRETFETFCNVAKINADKYRMVLISYWNNWAYDAQIEPSEGYGTEYLDIVARQFKK